MNIYLIWTNFEKLSKENTLIFNLEISQEENSFATADLLVDAIAPLPPTGTEGLIIREDKEILFKWLLVGNPVNIKEDFAEIRLIARPLDFMEKVASLQKKERVSPYWDDLWVQPKDLDNFHTIQDVRHCSLYCDRRTGELSYSDWFEGRQSCSVNQNFFSKSLSVKIVRAPLKACTVRVHAHWVQSEYGIINLGPAIRKLFPYTKVSTYTQNALVNKWPEPGKRLGRSGFWVLKSELKSVTPPPAFYPYSSPTLPFRHEGKIQSYRVKRFWFKPILWVGWQIQQKRKETLSITLTHAFQPVFPGEAKHKTLEFTLQNINPDPKAYPWRPETYYEKGAKATYKTGIYHANTSHMSGLSFEENQRQWTFKKNFHTPLGSPARASFFLTPRGYKAAEHAMERAKVILAQSARCLEVSFEGPWENLQNVTTDTTLFLSDPRLPGGHIKGKVVNYTFIAKGDTGERYALITLLCAVGQGEIIEKADYLSPHSFYEDYCEETYQTHDKALCKTSSGLSYFRYDDKGPSQKNTELPLLRRIELFNGPEEQEAEMQHLAYTSSSTLKKALSQKPTRLQFFFKDLRTKERIDHLIPVTMATPWSAPRQIELEKNSIFSVF